MSKKNTVEPQYNACIDLLENQGLSTLGIMSNQVWHDDPRRLVFMLSRYKFIAKMLSGKNSVAEIGCGDAFGSRIVSQEIKQLDVYDIDRVFINDINSRSSNKWPLYAKIHDILSGPLPYKYDAIFSLDVIEHIEKKNENLYVMNMVNSLKVHGALIIGSPTVESQKYASIQSQIGHVNCKTGSELKVFLQHYFNQVFIFSMNDEVVHTGFFHMAHYIFALCCDPKGPNDLKQYT